MKILICADIHGNLEAFEAVLKAEGTYDTLVVLGDLVGYGGNPNECVRLAQHGKNLICVKGNHDAALLGELNKTWFAKHTTKSLMFTEKESTEDTRNFLKNLPLTVDFNEDILFCHGSPSHPLTEYLLGDVETVQTFEKMRSSGKKCCFSGHSHLAIAYKYDGNNEMTAFSPKQNEKFFLGDDLWIFNPGSVGFPRTFNINDKGEKSEMEISLESFPAFYLIFDTEERWVEFKEVRYNAVKTAKKFASVGTLWYKPAKL